MGLFGKGKKEKEQEYMSKINVEACLKENFELIIDDVFTIIGVGTLVTGTVNAGMCRVGEKAYITKINGNIIKTTITSIDIHTKERKPNECAYKTEHVGIALRGVSKEQLQKGDKLVIKNAN